MLAFCPTKLTGSQKPLGAFSYVCNCLKALHAYKCHQQLLELAVHLPLWQYRGSLLHSSYYYSETQLFSMTNNQNAATG